MPAGARPTGIKEFDNGPLMNVSGMPTWQMLVTDRGISTTGTEGNWNEFGGFVAFDTAGFVVWYYDLPNDMYGCNWERLADGDFVFSVESTPSGFVQVDPLHNMKKGHLVSECDSITSTSALEMPSTAFSSAKPSVADEPETCETISPTRKAIAVRTSEIQLMMYASLAPGLESENCISERSTRPTARTA